jgi:hypothetical protein
VRVRGFEPPRAFAHRDLNLFQSSQPIPTGAQNINAYKGTA